MYLQIKEKIIKAWHWAKETFFRFRRFILSALLIATVGAGVISAPAIVLPDEFNQEVGCVLNVNGDWVAYNLQTGAHFSKVQDLDKKKFVDKVSTSTPNVLETNYRFKGAKKDSPCVIWEGKSLSQYSSLELSKKVAGEKISSAFNNIIKSAYAAVRTTNASDHINFGDNFNFVTTDVRTIEFWTLYGSKSTCEWMVSKDSNGGTAKNWLVFTEDCITDAGAIVFRVGGSNAGVRRYCAFGSSIDNSTWHHIAIVQNGSNNNCTDLTGYTDGISRSFTQYDTGTASGANTTTMNLGARGYDTGGGILTGAFDELRIWNTARTQDQILSNMFFRMMGGEDGLIGYWRLDEGVPPISRSFIDTIDGTQQAMSNVDSAPINYRE